jgi:hypothetical protein
MVIGGSTNDWLIDGRRRIKTTSPTMTLDNPKLQTQIEAGRQALGHGRAGHEKY